MDNKSNTILDTAVLYPAGTAHPAPPTLLTALYTCPPKQPNTRIVKLSWTAPASTPDLKEVIILRNDKEVGRVVAGTTEFFDGVAVDSMLEQCSEYVTYCLVSVDVLDIEGVISELITNLSAQANFLVDRLRRTLKDDPPDPRVRRWTDDDLILYLDLALCDLNVTPLATNFNCETLPQNMCNLLLTAARIEALQAQASIEVAKEFSMSAGGINMNIDRSPKYVALLTAERQAYEKLRDKVKLNFLMSRVQGEGVLSSPLPFRIRTFAPRQFRIR